MSFLVVVQVDPRATRERLMRSIEEKIDIENRRDEFRREIMNYIGALALDGKIAFGTTLRSRRVSR